MVGVEGMVMVFPAQEAVTPAGNPVAAPIPVAPVVEWVIGVSAVLMRRGGVEEGREEVLVGATIAFDGRAYNFFHGDIPGIRLEHAEDILSTNLKQFFEGFSQGSGSSIHLQFFSGEDSHHTWEAAFKAFGEALREALEPCPYRAVTTIGLKGTGMEGKL